MKYTRASVLKWIGFRTRVVCYMYLIEVSLTALICCSPKLGNLPGRRPVPRLEIRNRRFSFCAVTLNWLTKRAF